jgi:hypothetical protein
VSPDPLILATLVVLFGASLTIWWLHVHRDTKRRSDVVLREYARAHAMSEVEPAIDALPGPLRDVPERKLSVVIGFRDANTQILRLRSDDAAQQEWNVLVRTVATNSNPVGLRPTDAARSLLDAYQLRPSPWQPAGKRFTIVGDDLYACTKIAEGSGRALLPADLSLLRHGTSLVIDFSARPFDEVSIDRVRAVADQLAPVV